MTRPNEPQGTGDGNDRLPPWENRAPGKTAGELAAEAAERRRAAAAGSAPLTGSDPTGSDLTGSTNPGGPEPATQHIPVVTDPIAESPAVPRGQRPPPAAPAPPAARVSTPAAQPENPAPPTDTAAPRAGTPAAPRPITASQVITGTAAARFLGQQSAPAEPATDTLQPAAAPRGDGEPAGSRAPGVDQPTGNVQLPAEREELPDLDKIHHATPQQVESTATDVPRRNPAGQRTAVQLRRVDPWSVLRLTAILAVVLFLIWMVAVGVLYFVLDGMGVWDRLNDSIGTVTSADGNQSSASDIGAGAVFMWTALVGFISAVLFTALSTIGAFIYNICADVFGGVEVTFADRD